VVLDVFRIPTEDAIRAGFQTLGAISPHTARPGKDLPLDTPAFKNLLRQGIVREGAPGTFYLYENQRAPGLWIRQVLFWIVVVLIPVAIIRFCPGAK
jgi:hypothetical protein